jgi:hypothetical protein
MNATDHNLAMRNILTQLSGYHKSGTPIPEEMWTIVDQWSRLPFEQATDELCDNFLFPLRGELHVRPLAEYPPNVRAAYKAHSPTCTHVIVTDFGMCLAICNFFEEAVQTKKRLKELLTAPL